MPSMYLISAIWGGMDGSMLLWAVLLSLYCAVAARRVLSLPRTMAGWLLVAMNTASTFFLGVVTFLTNPFRLLDGLPQDGNGLNPLLQNPSMMIHPPSLYMGFTGLAIPFAYAIAALLSGEQSWTPLIRRFILVPWAFLSLGIMLGGNWAYIELGWGGFWAWDPVENASFLPWLTATALVHSVMVEERRGMLRTWNILLAVISYLLSVFGTFLTRSGVVQSVHAFAESDIGWVFLLYIGTVSAVTLIFVVLRWRSLRSENSFEGILSRESIFLINNLLLLSVCFATFWGVMFPVFSEAMFGEKNTVGPPFFNAVNGPLFIVLIFLMAVGPLVAWRRMALDRFWAVIRVPLFVGVLVTIGSLWFDRESTRAAAAFGSCAFLAASVFAEFRRGVIVRSELIHESRGAALLSLIRRKPRKYGGLLAHLGVAVIGVAIAASMLFKIERDAVLHEGEEIVVGRYVLKLAKVDGYRDPNYEALRARVEVRDANSGKPLDVLYPERRFYPRNEESTSEVDIRMTAREDLYIAFAGVPSSSDGANAGVFKIFVNPLQLWLWFGGGLLLLGTLVTLEPKLRMLSARESEKAVSRSAALPEGGK